MSRKSRKLMSNIADDTKLSHVYQLLYSQIEGGQTKSGTKLPTEQELAERFGYSRATVARAMRMLVDKGLIERRKRAGSFVRARQAVRAPLFGAIIGRTMPAHRSDNVFVGVSQEIAHRAELHAHALVVHDPGYKATSKQHLIERNDQVTRQLIERNPAGVFILPYAIDEGDEESLSVPSIREFDRAGIPVVLLDRDIYHYPKRSKYDLVGIDNKRAGYVLTKHLLSLGCRRIDFVIHASYASAAGERLEGYLQALWDHGIEPERSRVRTIEHMNRDYAETGFREQGVEDALRQTDAEAVVAVNDGMAARVMQAAMAIGKRVPEDLRIVGFDDLPQSRYLAVPLTTIRQPCEDLGQAALQTMFERIRNPGRNGYDVTVRSELVVRESCGAPAHLRTQSP